MIHLHLHSDKSILDGLGKIDKYIEKAKSLNVRALAITDHGNIDGCIQFYNKCTEAGVKPILGAELYIVKDASIRDKKEKRGHITILAKNNEGWVNLKRLVTYSYQEGFYYRPRIDVETLLKYKEGLIIMTACVSSFINFDWGTNLLYSLNMEDTYLEIMPHNLKEQIELNKKCIELSKDGFELIATNDCHYVDKKDAKAQEVLLAIQTKKQWSDKDRFKLNADTFWMMSVSEMIQGFEKIGVPESVYKLAIMNVSGIVNKCELKLEKKEVNLPLPMEIVNDHLYLDSKVSEGWTNKWDSFVEDKIYEYKDRIDLELKLIKEKGFTRYFIMVLELVDWCKKNDIMVGPGRGSSGGSLVCYLLGITQVDPIKWGLVFSRFISPDRKDLPDIDLDFEHYKRPLIRGHLEEVYGENNVAAISTFSMMKGRSTIRDVSRVFGVSLAEVNNFCQIIEQKLDGDEGSNETIKEAVANFEEGKKFYRKHKDVCEIAITLEGTTRQRGQHAAGIVVSDTNLMDGESCAIVHGKDKEPIINWDKEDIEFVGLMKLDVLGLNMLSVFNHCRKLINERTANLGDDVPFDFEKLNFEDIPLDDKKCYKEISEGHTIGCFQIGTSGLTKFCQQLHVDDFNDLMAATSLFRPGPLRSGMADTYIKRKHKEELLPEMHPIIQEITKETRGIILYQEQLMRICRELAGFEWDDVNKIRKLIAKSKGRESLRKYEDLFVEGCNKSRTLTEGSARSLWSELVTFGEYSFNKSHACCYSIITYWGIWLKVYYPVEYICALLTYGPDQKEKKNDYILEAFRLGIDIRPPKVGISDSRSWVIKDNKLYAPFMEIFGVGDKTADKFMLFDKKGFVDKPPVTQRFINILQNIDAFEDKPVTDDDADRISPLLGFSLVRNVLRRTKGISDKVSKFLDVKKIIDMDLKKIDQNCFYYYGQITELDLSVRRGKKEIYTSASAHLRDQTGETLIQFDSKLYQDKKGKIEGCKDEIVLVQANSPKKPGTLLVKNIWFYEELLNLEVDNLHLGMTESRRFKNKDLISCMDCELINECTKPVLPSTGSYNIMIIGEAPGRQEDQAEIGFIGESGQVLWDELKRKGYERNHFQVSNIVKCYPSRSKTPTKKQIKACSKWIKEELEIVKPPLILALGNTCIKFFTDDDSGIMNKCGTTTWNEEYECWICWCIHPASTIYSPENITMFRDGIDNFCKKIEKVSCTF